MLLDCATILTADESDPSKSIYFQTTDRTDWNQSNIYQWLNSGAEGEKINNGMGRETTGFLTQFTNADREAIASSTKKSKNVRDGGLKTAAGYSLIFTPLTDTKVFVLDSCELRNKSYGYPDKATSNCSNSEIKNRKNSCQSLLLDKIRTLFNRQSGMG